MEITADNDKLINELYSSLDVDDISFEKKDIKTDKTDNKKPMGACSFIVAIAAGTTIFVNLPKIIEMIQIFLDRYYPEWIAVIVGDKVDMTPEEYLGLSDKVRNACEKNFKVVIKKR